MLVFVSHCPYLALLERVMKIIHKKEVNELWLICKIRQK